MCFQDWALHIPKIDEYFKPAFLQLQIFLHSFLQLQEIMFSWFEGANSLNIIFEEIIIL